MKDVLIANGVELDMNEGIAFPIKFSINDLKNIKNRKRTYSQQITLPGTKRNRKFFNEVYGIHSGGDYMNFNPNITTPVRYYKSGNEILKGGTLQLQSVVLKNNDVEFKVQVFSSGVDIFLEMGNVSIRDIDYSDMNHILSRQAIKDSWTTPDGVGYRYALIQYRAQEHHLEWNTTDIVPYIHMVDIFDRIMKLVGQKYQSPFLQQPDMKKILFGFGGGDYINNTLSITEIANRRVLLTSGDFATELDYTWNENVWQLIKTGNIALNATNFTSTTSTDVYNQWNGNSINILKKGKYNIAITGRFVTTVWLESNPQYSGLLGINAGKFSILVNGVSVHDQVFTNQNVKTNYNINDPATYPSKINQITINTGLLELNENDIVELYFSELEVGSGTTWSGDAILTLKIGTIQGIQVDLTSLDTQVTDGDLIQISRFLPEMTCADFMIGFFRQFNLVMSDEDINGVVTITPLSDFYLQQNIYDDISDIIDYKQPIEIVPSSTILAKRNFFSFKKRDEEEAILYIEKWGQEYGDYEFKNYNHFGSGEEKIEVPWSGIVPFEIDEGILIPRFIIRKNGEIKPIRGSGRIMYWNGLKPGTWKLSNTINSMHETLSSYPCVHHFNDWENPTLDLNFSLVEELYYEATLVATNNCFRRFYRSYYEEMRSPHGKIWRGNIKVNSGWVKSLDFRKLKMINGALFRMNSLGSFDDNITESTPVELVRYINDYS